MRSPLSILFFCITIVLIITLTLYNQLGQLGYTQIMWHLWLAILLLVFICAFLQYKSQLSALCTVRPCESKLGWSHLATRCTTVSLCALRRDTRFQCQSHSTTAVRSDWTKEEWDIGLAQCYLYSPLAVPAKGAFWLRGVFFFVPARRGWSGWSWKGRVSFFRSVGCELFFVTWRKASGRCKGMGQQSTHPLERKTLGPICSLWCPSGCMHRNPSLCHRKIEGSLNNCILRDCDCKVLGHVV